MKKIEVKKDSFLKNAKNYALKKKEKPAKLPMPPDAISALKVKFMFAKVEEITLTPERLSFFKERFGMKTKGKVTDTDPSKTYYVAYLEALLQELAKSGIYVGMNVEDRFHALSAYVEAIKGGKIIIEVIPKVAFSSSSVGIEERESGGFTVSDRTLSSLIESPSLDLLTETTQVREDAEKYKKKIEEQEATIARLEVKVEACQKALEEDAFRAMKNHLETVRLREMLEEAQREAARLRIFEPKGKEEEKETQTEEETEDDSENPDGREDEIGRLIEKIEAKEVAKVPLITESIRQWVCRLAGSRGERVTAPLYNPETTQEEAQTLPRFLAIAKLEEEKATHFAKYGDPWPKADLLARMRDEGYGIDLSCLFLYRQENFPRELRTFAVLFAFWEAAHHNRFYRNALAIALNSGAIPANVGIAADTPHTDGVLRLLHYTDLTRILMGHYGAIAQNQFNIDLFPSQKETMARFGEAAPDISRTTTEGALFI
jgi:hypothetical protein